MEQGRDGNVLAEVSDSIEDAFKQELYPNMVRDKLVKIARVISLPHWITITYLVAGNIHTACRLE